MLLRLIGRRSSTASTSCADPNILGVIGRLAELGPDDVVLEIGPGQGVLTRYLAERVRRVHAVEIDRALEPALGDLADNVDVVFGDALQLDLPQDATKLVANLPTTSRRRSSSRASTGCRTSGSGA